MKAASLNKKINELFAGTDKENELKDYIKNVFKQHNIRFGGYEATKVSEEPRKGYREIIFVWNDNNGQYYKIGKIYYNESGNNDGSPVGNIDEVVFSDVADGFYKNKTVCEG